MRYTTSHKRWGNAGLTGKSMLTLVGSMLASAATAAPFMYVYDTNGTLSVVDLAANRVVDTVIYGESGSADYPYALDAHQKTADIYVSNKSNATGDYQLSIVDGVTARVTKSLKFNGSIDEVVAHPGLSKLYVNPFLSKVSVVSAKDMRITTNAIQTTFPSVDIDVSKSRLFGMEQDGWDYGFFVVDTNNDTVLKEVFPAYGLGDDQVIKIAAHPLGDYLYVLDYDYYVGAKLDVRSGATLDLVTSVPTNFGAAKEMKVSPDAATLAVIGDPLYNGNRNEITFMSLTNYTVLGTMSFVKSLSGRLIYSKDSKTLYVLEGNLLHLIDIKTRSISSSISLAGSPVNIAMLDSLPSDLAGVVGGMAVTNFQCQNFTTGQIVSRDIDGRSDWNCSSLEFNAASGDAVQVIVNGTR